MAEISAAIIAGGAAKRFNGIIKANIEIDGETIISGMIGIIGEIFDEIIIVTNTPEAFHQYSCYKIVEDYYSGRGPLGGIHAALRASTNNSVFVFAGDMPYLDSDIILRVIDAYKDCKCDVLVPRIEELTEPLHSVYNLSVLKELDNLLAQEKDIAVRDFIENLDVIYLQLEASEKNKRAFTNINSPSDILMARGKSNG